MLESPKADPSSSISVAIRPLNDEAVVLVHGLGGNRLWMSPLSRHLASPTRRTVNWAYPSHRDGVAAHAARFSRLIEDLEAENSVRRWHLVTHSMGSIIARQALTASAPQRLHRIVMLGPPNRGSRVARHLARVAGFLCPPLRDLSDACESLVNQLPRSLPYETGIIGAAYDRVVALDSTRLGNETDHVVVPTGHTRMLFQRDVWQLVAQFLDEGSFAPRDLKLVG